ncbi:U2 small nuclear ribonucleoprotein auxiliary factor 35 kDa subunit-related protein 1 [Dunckerocampus dactyliophorus]|uniref:U2 small nuclear ribonucleoprotein auxiliary factor 35 kDa subunit-related protein 1 n=1 Tax=Dunckerocampus dactyliophorus TaxID=161453 RepID=UPI002404B1AB|nr:U2 small nuclear ribonucleoprotein auxiliary factor 35 kDa subunit-related protein 1 [Dunckerocampus dactyliophorus]
MAALIPPLSWAPALSHKQRKAASRKERRKRKRQAIAQARECALHNGATVDPPDETEEDDDVDAGIVEQERQRLHEEWLEREHLAQEEFRLKSEREEAARKRKEDEERRIKEEWEAQQRREQEEKELKQQEKRDREEAVQKMLDEAENQLSNGGPWMNPEAPVTERSENFGTERDAANCSFFLKTGACRFGDRCSRKHVYPSTSSTLMIRGMFITFGMEQSRRDDYDGDACLEHSEEELQESFIEFYHDVLPEFKTVGKVVQFKVSCNYEPHLRGNVYVQFDTEEQCREAFIKFNGRFYAGKQLHCEISPVTRWKNAICGLFDRKRCPKGKHCNFLHVFRNPGNEFWEADRDLHISPNHSIRGSHSERQGDRSWRHHHWSRSPLTSERSYSRREDDRHSERSGKSRTAQYQRDERRSFGSAYYDRGRDRYRSRSRDKSRSRSRDRSHRRSREKDRKENIRNKSKERNSLDKNGDIRHRSRQSSRDAEKKKQPQEKSVNRSPEKKEANKSLPDENTNRHRHHKHTKKSKKKSKKKHKKRSHSPNVMSSSGESDKEPEEETVDKHSVKSPSGQNEELLQENNDLSGNPSTDGEKSCDLPMESDGCITKVERGLENEHTKSDS